MCRQYGTAWTTRPSSPSEDVLSMVTTDVTIRINSQVYNSGFSEVGASCCWQAAERTYQSTLGWIASI
ncbi:hypothetical protein LY78DRAFT_651477 [Colletotrichum sublineola]|nr:hypothetical protein LY78DRAFT_651477 [Colletotrichum sublineola]